MLSNHSVRTHLNWNIKTGLLLQNWPSRVVIITIIAQSIIFLHLCLLSLKKCWTLLSLVGFLLLLLLKQKATRSDMLRAPAEWPTQGGGGVGGVNGFWCFTNRLQTARAYLTGTQWILHGSDCRKLQASTTTSSGCCRNSRRTYLLLMMGGGVL